MTMYNDIRFGLEINKRLDFNAGVNNVGNKLPPYGLVGSGNGAIYDSRGRFMYLGFRVKV